MDHLPETKGKEMKLTEDEIIQIMKLLENSQFEELDLEMGELKLHVRKAGALPRGGEGDAALPSTKSVIAPNSPAKATGTEATAAVRAEKSQPTPVEKTAPAPEEGLVPINAPILGTFYRRPSPGAPEYVEVGSYVRENDTVCLLEVMKVFSSVKAGVNGYVEKACVESGSFVEYGQTLFWVRPADPPEEKPE